MKPGVELAGVRSEIVVAMLVCHQLLGDEFVVTSVRDGKHMRGSLHYVGHAMDIACPSWFGAVDKLRERLGPEYDVVDEGDHVHIEFQPK